MDRLPVAAPDIGQARHAASRLSENQRPSLTAGSRAGTAASGKDVGDALLCDDPLDEFAWRPAAGAPGTPHHAATANIVQRDRGAGLKPALPSHSLRNFPGSAVKGLAWP